MPQDRPEFLLERDAAALGIASLEAARGYLEGERAAIEAEVAAGKAVVFRGFPVAALEEFHGLISCLNPDLVPYSGAKVQNADDPAVRLYSPTSTPPHRKNFLHNEMAYQRDVPSRITIYCQRPAPRGGESLLGDQREVYRRIRPASREKLERRGLRFVRYLKDRTRLHAFLTRHLDVFALLPSWQGNLGTEDRAAAQARCEAEGFECEWTADGGLLITCEVSPTRPHPVDGEPMWVNNAHLFQLHRAVFGSALTALFSLFYRLTGTPRTTCTYADGAPIEPAVTEDILAATEAAEVPVPLRAGDFVYANNLALGHGRTVFSGPRRLYFGVFA